MTTAIGLQNGVVTEWGEAEFNRELLQLAADFSNALRAAFADDDTCSLSNKVSAERQPNLAASLDSNYLAPQSLSQPFSSSLQAHVKGGSREGCRW
jgi:hypothetical protein